MKRGYISLIVALVIGAILLKQQQLFLSLLLLGFSLFFVIKNNRKLIILIPLIVVFFYFYTPSIRAPTNNIDNEIAGEFTIFEKGNNYFLVKNKKNNYLIYSDIDLEVGDKCYLEGKLKVIRGYAIPNLSSFANYLLTKEVVYQLEITSIIKKDNYNLRSKIKNLSFKNLNYESVSFLKLLIFGEKLERQDLYSDLKELNIVQLFVISGFHINVLFDGLNYIFRKKKIITFSVLFFYLYMLNFSLSALRAFLMLLFSSFLIKKQMNRYQIFGIVLIVMLIYKPLALFSLSLQLSFLASFSLLIISNLKIKPFIKPFFVSIFAYLFILPLLINMKHEVSLLNFIFNAVLSLPVSLLYLGGFLVMIFKFLDVVYFPLIIAFENLIIFLKTINPALIIAHLNSFKICLYYLLILSIFYFKSVRLKKTYYISLFLFSYYIGYLYFSPNIYSPFMVTFLDVGQGDATIIKGQNNSFCILIDTGGNFYSDISVQRTIPYLKSLGIRSLDLVIITHDDYDHSGALPSLITNFKVKKVAGENFQSYANDNLIIKNINNYQDATKDNNYNSLVLHVEYYGYNFLIMGDAPIEIEKKIIKDYNIVNLHVLRLGHHGSKTSTSMEFLNHFNPDYAIISVGYNNGYGHPHQEVITALKQAQIKYYRSDYDGTIVYRQKKFIKSFLIF